MGRKFIRRFLVSALLLAGIASAGSAQAPRKDFNRPQTFDVQHYILRVSFDHAKRTVFGDTTVSLKPIKDGLTVVQLDAADLSFSSVTVEGEDKLLKYKTSNRTVLIELGRAYKAGETISLRLKYTAKPKKGVYFIDEEKDEENIVHSAQIWTQGQPDEAHHWFPSFDFPSDKATTEQIITVEKSNTVIGNGDLVERRENPDGTATFHYRMMLPYPTYLVSFVVGRYEKITDMHRKTPLGYYVYPGTERIVPLAFGKTKEMMKVFERVTKVDYPFNKYDQTIVSGFTSGGMENITATTLADSEIFLANVDFVRGSVEDLVAHEIAHSWFGNLVTCRNWAELWLNEGFATFMEAVARENMYGRADYIRKINVDANNFIVDDAVTPRRFALFNQTAEEVDKLFDRPATTYNKGGAVLHTLRKQVGDEAFWKAVNIYLNRHRLGSVESTDLRKVMEETSGQKLDWFFEQWVYGTGYPKLEIKQTWNADTKTLNLGIAQTQKTEKLSTAAYRLPIEIEIKIGDITETKRIEVTKRAETFTFNLAAEPASVTFDKNSRIPIKTVKLEQVR
ncbi:MAG: M1 family metallopeptidase [Blastocatellia bacterium]